MEFIHHRHHTLAFESRVMKILVHGPYISYQDRACRVKCAKHELWFGRPRPTFAFMAMKLICYRNRMSVREVSKEYNVEPAKHYTPSDEITESQTMGWICKEVVIGYKVCPFAEKPLRENKLYISVVRALQ